MRGLVLDPTTGRPFATPETVSEARRQRAIRRAPAHVLDSLERARELHGPWEPRASLQTWHETLYSSIATETALTAAAIGLVFPAYYGNIPANYLQPHRTLHLRVFGQLSTAATPGTFLEQIRLDTTGGTVLVATAATTMSATQTNISWRGEWYLTCRTDGTAGTVFCSGIIESAAIPTTGQMVAPPSAPATAACDTTVAHSIVLAHTPSLATASMQGMQWTFDTLN